MDVYEAINNPYARGAWTNLKEIIWPQDLHDEAWLSAPATVEEAVKQAVKEKKSGGKKKKH